MVDLLRLHSVSRPHPRFFAPLRMTLKCAFRMTLAVRPRMALAVRLRMTLAVRFQE